jgi:hypothetical protein
MTDSSTNSMTGGDRPTPGVQVRHGVALLGTSAAGIDLQQRISGAGAAAVEARPPISLHRACIVNFMAHGSFRKAPSGTLTGAACSSRGPKHAEQEQSVNDELKQVWVASAAVETLHVKMDQAETALTEAIDEALKAGEDPAMIGGAANLTPAELSELAPDLPQPAGR